MRFSEWQPKSRPAKSSPKGHSGPRAEYAVRAELWLYPGAGGWHFVNLSIRQSEEIRVRFASEARGFGSLPVTVRIGETEWRTSIFPDRKSKSYLFAVKAAVRRKERIEAGDRVTALLRIV
jgi:Domain of unknown function (DUF1905).